MNKTTLFALIFTLLFTGCSSSNKSTTLPQKNNSASALYNKAVELRNKKKLPEAIALYKQAANKGHSEAQNSLGFLHERGIGVKRNYSRAIYWYKKAASQNNSTSLNNLGYLYHYGYGVKRNKAIAYNFYQKALKLGSPDAKHNLKQWVSDYGNQSGPVKQLTVKKTNNSTLDKKKMERFKNEIIGLFSKNINNKSQSKVFVGSLLWATHLANWKNPQAYSVMQNEGRKYRPSNPNYCSSLINVLDNNVSLYPSLAKVAREEAATRYNLTKRFEASGIAKHNVSVNDLGRMIEYGNVWNRPPVCSCVINSEVTRFCRKYAYQPL